MSMQSPRIAGPRYRVETMLSQLAGPWWLLLVTGIVWLVIAMIVLRFRLASVAAVGVLMGVVFLGGWLSEVLIASMRLRWRWAHLLMAILFLFAACWSFASPFSAFWALATIFGLLLIWVGFFALFRAFSDILLASEVRGLAHK